jgi:hypothetical protein
LVSFEAVSFEALGIPQGFVGTSRDLVAPSPAIFGKLI